MVAVVNVDNSGDNCMGDACDSVLAMMMEVVLAVKVVIMVRW